MSNTNQASSNHGNVNSKPQQNDDSTVIRRTLIERGIRPVNDGISSTGKTSTIAALAAINQQHQNEKRDLQDLNAKFAVYLDRVQYLEDTNQRLNAELLRLKESWGGDTKELKSIYDPQLQGLRRELNDAIQDQIRQELQIKRYDNDVWQCHEQISVFDGSYDVHHLNTLKQELDTSVLALDRLKNEYEKSVFDLNRLRNLVDSSLEDVNSLKNELDSQQLERIMIDSELQTLKEHVAFQNAVYQLRRAEMLSLDTPAIDVSSFYRAELAHAISDIRRDFDTLFQTQTSELEEYYRVKTEQVRQEIEAENERKRLLAEEGAVEVMDPVALTTSMRDSQNELLTLRNDNKKLQADLDAIVNDLERIQDEQSFERESHDKEIILAREDIENKQNLINAILDNNVSLRFELSTYRGLLQVEEQHLSRMQHTSQTQNSLSASEGVSALMSTSPTTPPRLANVTIGSSSSSSSTAVPNISALAAALPTPAIPDATKQTSGPSSRSSTHMPALASAFPSPGASTTWTSSSSGSTSTSMPSNTPGLTTGLSSVYQNKPLSSTAHTGLETKKMTIQKTARGPITFDSVDLENDAIILINERYGGSEQSFRNWSIRRQVDQQPEIIYNFPSTFLLKPRQTIRVFSKRTANSASSFGDSIIADDIYTWSIGHHMVTRLVDDNNEEKAIITQIFQ